MQSNEGEGAKSKESGPRGYLSGPGVSDSYMIVVRTPTKPPQAASSLQGNGRLDRFPDR